MQTHWCEDLTMSFSYNTSIVSSANSENIGFLGKSWESGDLKQVIDENLKIRGTRMIHLCS